MQKKKILMFSLFVLFLLPALCSSAATGNGSQFALAEDSDESSESIYYFNESLPDNTMFYPDNETHGTGYAESFTDDSDWTTENTSISTDGDVATITENGAGSTGRAYASFASTDYYEYYYEFRVSTMTATTCDLEFWDGSAYNTLHTFTGAGTYKDIIADSDAVTMQRIGFLVGSEGGNIKPDYLRISPSDEMGWGHDGSTTVGVTNSGNAGVTFTTTTDGDILTLTALRTSGSGTLIVSFYISYDTTTTGADIERDYYPFFELNCNATLQGGQTYVAPMWHLDGKYVSGVPAITEDGTFRDIYVNSGAFTGNSANKYVGFYANLNAVGKGFTVELDWVKAYSIANDSITQSGTTYDDYLYVDSGTLYSHVDDGTIELNHDPALSISDTYPVHYNLTTSTTAPEFSMFVSSWSAYTNESYGITTSGTLTDIKLKFSSTEIISEIKFTMQQISILSELFLSTELWGYFGPVGLVIIGYLLIQKEKALGIFMIIVDSLVISHYLTLVAAMPSYWWNIFILLLGVITCTFQMMKR